MNVAIKILLNTFLSFIAQTIKNPKSVEKFKGIFQLIAEGVATILSSLGGTTSVAASGKFGTAEHTGDILSRIDEAKASLKV